MPYIKDESIQAVKDAINIAELIGSYIEVKKDKACCPFHDEKSPSFSITKTKGIFKCFGCGASGDGVKFVMMYDRIDFFEAINKIAKFYNINLEYDKTVDPDTTEKQNKKAEIQRILKASEEKYYQNVFRYFANFSLSYVLKNEPNEINHVANYLISKRGITLDSIIKWKIGFAPDQWRFLTDLLVDKGLFEPAREIGLVQNSKGKNFDTFRNRIIFPIHDHFGNTVGFGGRKLDDTNKENPKYINSADSIIYSKEKVLYGLNHAQKAIKDLGFAILTEGYVDVISMHQNGLENTVASCGTALTGHQARLLKRYTNTVFIMYDGDEAGKKATLKAIDILLAYDFNIEVVDLPGEDDPDTYIQKLTKTL